MYFPRRLRQNFNATGFIPALVCLFAAALAWIIAGLKAALILVAVVYILYAGFSLWIYTRTINISYLAASVWQLFIGLFILTTSSLPVRITSDHRLGSLIFICLVFSTVWFFYTIITRKAKWKGQEVFELASMQIENQSGGFTERPRPAGKTEFTKDELIGFAEYLKRNLIAMPFPGENKIVFFPVKMDDSYYYLLKPRRFRMQKSWVSFDYEGNVSVFIAHPDYLGYKDELSFDQLCENLGKLFIRYMEYYRRGEAERIVYQLNELGLGLTY